MDNRTDDVGFLFRKKDIIHFLLHNQGISNRSPAELHPNLTFLQRFHNNLGRIFSLGETVKPPDLALLREALRTKPLPFVD